MFLFTNQNTNKKSISISDIIETTDRVRKNWFYGNLPSDTSFSEKTPTVTPKSPSKPAGRKKSKK